MEAGFFMQICVIPNMFSILDFEPQFWMVYCSLNNTKVVSFSAYENIDSDTYNDY